jgi:hypothetical protein
VSAIRRCGDHSIEAPATDGQMRLGRSNVPSCAPHNLEKAASAAVMDLRRTFDIDAIFPPQEDVRATAVAAFLARKLARNYSACLFGYEHILTPEKKASLLAKRFLDEAQGKASLKEYERQVAFWTECFKGQPLRATTRARTAQLVEGPRQPRREIAISRAFEPS